MHCELQNDAVGDPDRCAMVPLAMIHRNADNMSIQQGIEFMRHAAGNPDQKFLTGVLMDPVHQINTRKDSTFAMMLESQRRGQELVYMESADLWVEHGVAKASWRSISVRDNPADWFTLGPRVEGSLGDLDVILMRLDPPFNMRYVHLTYLLNLAEAQGALVVNRPQALRDNNEKLSIAQFPQCCAPFAVVRQAARARAFVMEQGRSVVKPLDGMGGESIFQLDPADPNLNVILEAITRHDQELVMVQCYIPKISEGDKRILLVDGEPVPYALARIPGDSDFRGNLAKGGTGKAQPLTARDRWICEQVAPTLRNEGILFAGLDVIGEWLTEINVTSPTCIRELDAAYDLNIAGQLFDVIERRVAEGGA